jgi:hypothetical protein
MMAEERLRSSGESHPCCETSPIWGVAEARWMARVAREKGRAARLGSQGTAMDRATGGDRRGVPEKSAIS